MKKLNFGCGSIQPEGWVNFDIDPEFKASEYEFKQEEFDIIVAHAVVQQFEWHDMVGELRFLGKLLKTGGVLRISLPDIYKGFQAYERGEIDWFPNQEADIDDRFSAWLTWYSTSKTLLTKDALINKLAEAGFKTVNMSRFKQSSTPGAAELDTRNKEFYFVEAIK